MWFRAIGFVLAGMAWAGSLPPGAQFVPGPVNGLRLGESLVVYGNAAGKRVLVTHARRDLAAAAVRVAGAEVFAPTKERHLLEHPEAFWQAFETERFHDYSQISTKVPVRPLAVTRAVSGGDTFEMDGAKVIVLDTPGYTAGAVTYLIEFGGRRIACTGDLIYGDGQLFDLYSLQDAVPEAKARGYHGYAARAGDLIASLRKVAEWKPDVIVPARGPVIEDPMGSMGKLVERLQGVMRSHFTTDALRWYWGDDNLRTRAGKALDGKMPEWMPMAERAKLPEWVIPISNSRLIVSTSGAAFLVDAGYSKIIPELEKLQAAGIFKTLEGVWITHYHDDHTDNAQAVADRFKCPVYFNDRLRDVLERPAAYRMPCLTTNAISSGMARADGSSMRWHEFQLTMQFFPGQTLYHDGLSIVRETGESLYFAGDSFTPSGMDDYCLQNRDFLREGEGFLACLDSLSKTKAGTWVLNQHVEPMFRYTETQIVVMRREMHTRMDFLRALSPWPDLNYEVDEGWARVYPYGSEVAPKGRVTLELKILNHSPKRETYNVLWTAPAGLTLVKSAGQVTIPARTEGKVQAVFEGATPGLHVVTADVEFGGRVLKEWVEAMVRVK
ncbi:MAG: MBL fold metallo-hydrolase [Bryobacteraceae bacterium]